MLIAMTFFVCKNKPQFFVKETQNFNIKDVFNFCKNWHEIKRVLNIYKWLVDWSDSHYCIIWRLMIRLL